MLTYLFVSVLGELHYLIWLPFWLKVDIHASKSNKLDSCRFACSCDLDFSLSTWFTLLCFSGKTSICSIQVSWAYSAFFNCMFSATFPRGARQPLRIGPRATRDSPALSRLVVGRQVILTTIFGYVGLDRDWFSLRGCCCHLFIFWHFPAAVPDPPVAVAFGPEPFSDMHSISDDSE